MLISVYALWLNTTNSDKTFDLCLFNTDPGALTFYNSFIQICLPGLILFAVCFYFL